MEGASEPEQPVGRKGLAATAAHGSAWMTAQTVVNKVVTLFAGILLARLLLPADYGLAFFAANLSAYFFILPTFVLGDVVLASPRRFASIAGAVDRVARIAGAVMFIALAALAFPIQQFDGRTGLAFLIVVAATRVLADAMLAVPFARMRLDLEYRRISIIDGTVMLTATAVGVALAYFGAGPISLTLPPIFTIAVRAFIYRRLKAKELQVEVVREEVRPVVRQYVEAGLGQYLNNILIGLEIVVLGFMTGETELGLFSLAANYAVQANIIIAVQLSSALQPIFGHIQDDPKRQIAAFMRATRFLTAVAAPLSLVQAAVAVPAFTLLFQPKWSGSIAVFAALSVGQAFIFMSTPAVGLLKAQGRFRAYLLIQFLQAVCAVTAFYFAVRFGGDAALSFAEAIGLPVDPQAGKALALAIASTVVWSIFCPIMVWMAGRPARLGIGTTLGAFLEPWIVAVPVTLALIAIWTELRAHASTHFADIATLVVVAPIAAIVAIIGCLLLRAETRADAKAVLQRFRRRRAPAA